MISVPVRSRTRTRGIALAAAVPLVLASCSTDSSDGASATASTDISVVATTTIWADVTSSVLCGLDVAAVVPVAADPHTFEPSLADRSALQSADLVVANGLDLEEGLVDLLSTVADDGVPVLELTEGVTIGDIDGHVAESENHDDHDEHESDEHESDDHDDHDHASGDPHIWLDPLTVADAVPAIIEAAIAAGADTSVRACGQDYIDELEALDGEIRSTLAVIPDDARYLVTNHDAFGYFAARYDLEVVGAVIPSLSSLAETNPADLANLAALIEELDLPAIFAEEQSSDIEASALADVLPGVRVATLDTGSLRDSEDTYTALMRRNAQIIAEALG